MSTREAPSNNDDFIDSRDVIARIEELEGEIEAERELLADFPQPAEVPHSPARQTRLDNIADLEADLAQLKALAEEAEDHVSGWRYGATLIRDTYFEEYARELAEDIGAIDRNANWPLGCIDWKQAADELKMDYTSVDFDGETYWIR